MDNLKGVDWTDVHEYYARQQPPSAGEPDAPGCAGLSDSARAEARRLYGESAMAKQAGALNADEKAFLRASARAILADMGY